MNFLYYINNKRKNFKSHAKNLRDLKLLTAKPKLTKICYTIQIIYTDGNLNMTGFFYSTKIT